VLNVFAAQGWHCASLEAPSTAPKVPAGQALHEKVPGALQAPFAQQMDAPTPLEPPPQGRHAEGEDPAAVGLYFPGGHGVQNAAPPVLYVPKAHGEHLPGSELPAKGLDVPAEQAVQEACPMLG